MYHDIFLLDLEGNIVSAALHRELMGQNQADRSWFREAVAGKLVVTDLYSSRSINDTTLAFSCPVRSPEGAVIGVLTTRFNCQYIYDIMGSTIVGKGCGVYLVNSKGLVIGSPTGEGIFENSLSHLKAFRSSQKQPFGYTIETDGSKQECAIGFARTSGYLNYPGKSWTVLIRSEVGERSAIPVDQTVNAFNPINLLIF